MTLLALVYRGGHTLVYSHLLPLLRPRILPLSFNIDCNTGKTPATSDVDHTSARGRFEVEASGTSDQSLGHPGGIFLCLCPMEAIERGHPPQINRIELAIFLYAVLSPLKLKVS